VGLSRMKVLGKTVRVIFSPERFLGKILYILSLDGENMCIQE
jgi:hypothetical protein